MKIHHICSICKKEERGSWDDETNLRLLKEKICFSCDFWNSKIKIKDNPNSVRIKGEQYFIGDEEEIGRFRGFDGMRFKIKFNDGREVTTTNLWYNGKIPITHQKELTDNAIFLKEFL